MGFTVATVNVNGVRAAVKQRAPGAPTLLTWLGAHPAAVVLLQEVRATAAQAEVALEPLLSAGWHLTHAESELKGRAGVAILSRAAPTAVQCGVTAADASGRYVQAAIDGVTYASVYVPKGAPEGESLYHAKLQFLDDLTARLQALGATQPAVVGGDFNIAPAELDIKNWKGNRRSPGFLPAEREWVAARLASGWRDVVRDLAGDTAGPYSWWSWRGKAFDNDSGWRIDYLLSSGALAARRAGTDRANAYDQRWSDHAPVWAEFTH